MPDACIPEDMGLLWMDAGVCAFCIPIEAGVCGMTAELGGACCGKAPVVPADTVLSIVRYTGLCNVLVKLDSATLPWPLAWLPCSKLAINGAS
jgi:hypothetical protein